MKKTYIILGIVIVLFLGWRIYQNGVPSERMMNTIQTLEDKEDIIRLFNSNGEDITEKYYDDNEFHYKMKNWKSIYNYFQENVSSTDYSRDPNWLEDVRNGKQ